MSDLVERLRAYSDQLGGITDEAADEIERWKTIAKTLFNAKVLKMQGFSAPFTTVPTPEQAEAREIAKSDAMTTDEIEREMRKWCANVDVFLKRCSEAVIQGHAKALQNGCKHIITEDDCGSAVCGLCGKDFGWYCQISPTNVCDYYDDECCMYCGAPEERQ